MTIQNTGKKVLDLHMETGNTILLRSSKTGQVSNYRLKGICKKIEGDLEIGLVLDLEKLEELP